MCIKMRIIRRLISLVTFIVFVFSLLPTPVKWSFATNSYAAGAPITKNDVLSIQNGQFYFEGKPYAEISFNKFDLFWGLWGEAKAGRAIDSTNSQYIAQDKALKELHDLGFRTIRIFGAPWENIGFRECFDDPTIRNTKYWEPLDKALELCDKYDIRVVFSLGAGTFRDVSYNNGFVFGAEHQRELIGDPNSNSRKRLNEYLDLVINRYKDRKTIFMWEISNELVLSADIGIPERVYNGERMPTMSQIVTFYKDVATRIKLNDSLRIINSGSSTLRTCNWNLMNKTTWDTDTLAQQKEIYKLLFDNSNVDVFDMHYYVVREGGFSILDNSRNPMLLNIQGLNDIATNDVNIHMMLGEIGVLPDATNPTGYFSSYTDTVNAKIWVQKTVDEILNANVPLTYWWAYQDDRPFTKGSDRQDINIERDPELIQIIVNANKALKQRTNSINILSFESNGGSLMPFQEVSPNTCAMLPSPPTKIGNIFSGWYADSGLTTVFNFATPITVNTTVYAKWSPVSSLNTEFNYVTGKVKIWGDGKFNSGDNVTLLVRNPSNNINYIDQTTAGTNGSFEFYYTLGESTFGTYDVRIGGTGVSVPYSDSFKVYRYLLSSMNYTDNKIYLHVFKNSGSEISESLIITSYNNNKIEDCKIEKLTMLQGDTGTITSNIKIPVGGTVKAFVWNSLDKIYPLSNVMIYQTQ